MSNRQDSELKIHHTGYTVSDLDRSLGFYRDLLGCEVVATQEKQGGYLAAIVGYPDAHVRMAHLRAPHSTHVIELFEYLAPSPVDPRNPSRLEPCNVGTSHISFVVNDLDAVYERLTAAGVDFSAPRSTSTRGSTPGARRCTCATRTGSRWNCSSRRGATSDHRQCGRRGRSSHARRPPRLARTHRRRPPKLALTPGTESDGHQGRSASDRCGWCYGRWGAAQPPAAQTRSSPETRQPMPPPSPDRPDLPLIDRRTLLRLAGTAAVAAPGLSVLGTVGTARGAGVETHLDRVGETAAAKPRIALGGAPVRPPSIPLAVRSPVPVDVAAVHRSDRCRTPVLERSRAWVGRADPDRRPAVRLGGKAGARRHGGAGDAAEVGRGDRHPLDLHLPARGVELVAEWLSPIEPGDLQLQSVPLSLLTLSVSFDGRRPA